MNANPHNLPPTYTVIDYNGDVIARGLSLAEAANEILSTDSREWEIRPINRVGLHGWRLWTRQQVAHLPWTPTVVFSLADNQSEAEAEIFAEVVRADWPRHYSAMTDESYNQSLAESES